eukprot:Hpha_TRINITY_DN14869_c3_g1::TRINITY_DN14869_c3_g1_i1::g.169552::m.169552/K07151/STT3; dolichyl-diphosphooligosaccharide--protein glycosyltransferase
MGIMGAVVGRLFESAGLLLRLMIYFFAAFKAYTLRLYAIRNYGKVIHEFDPWFNFRATQYLADNGWHAFFHWFDYMSWYPLGRPVGTTIYPGMQIIAVWIWQALKLLPKGSVLVPKRIGFEPFWFSLTGVSGKYKLQPSMSLNDVCVFVPAWFGVLATLSCGMMAAEASGSSWAGVGAAVMMSMIPAHMMRSVGGGFDNESVAVTALCMTFWLWCRAIRTPRSWPWGIPAGLAYVYMAAAWGGYIAVCNMIAAHAGLLVLLGWYSSGLHRAYTLWYIVGTSGAMMVPVIGTTPIRSMEQVLPLIAFVGLQVLAFCDYQRKKLSPLSFALYRVKIICLVAAVAGFVGWVLMLLGYWQPFSSRIRGLMIKHTRTGNPLVDSVSEHQPGNNDSYWSYLHYGMYTAPVGLCMQMVFRPQRPGSYFLLTYALVAYHFSLKMSRLIIVCGPIVSALTGVAAGLVLDFMIAQIKGAWSDATGAPPPEEPETDTTAPKEAKKEEEKKKAKKEDKGKARESEKVASKKPWPMPWEDLPEGWLYAAGSRLADSFGLPAVYRKVLRFKYSIRFIVALVRLVVVVGIAWQAYTQIPQYYKKFARHSEEYAVAFSNPRIMFKAQNGQTIDDYREAYWWLRDNTPDDARVMSWWDYGYQITGIANRTTIADGNTWNHEHIATLGRCLTSPEPRAHRMIRHLADYVLVWGGGRKDDLAKSPHMARIGNSVYSDICPGDPKCTRYGFQQNGDPTPMMGASLLYKLVQHNVAPKVRANPKYFKHSYTSKHGLVRIFQVQNVSAKSKAWVANPDNRVCDAPGSWYCPGQYPPGFQKLIQNRRDFAQLEDFNRRSQGKSAYTKHVESQGGEL